MNIICKIKDPVCVESVFFKYYCYFLFLEKKKVTKEKFKANPIAPRVLPCLRHITIAAITFSIACAMSLLLLEAIISYF